MLAQYTNRKLEVRAWKGKCIFNFIVNEEFHEKHEYKLLNYPKRNENVYLAYSLKLYSLWYATSQQFDEPTLHNVTHDKG